MRDAGLDDQKVFDWISRMDAEFVVRVAYRERRVETYNPRLDRWESKRLGDLSDTVPFYSRWRVPSIMPTRSAGERSAWGGSRSAVPKQDRLLWVLVAHDPDLDHDVILITNVPIEDERDAQTLYIQWRYRPRIEHS